MQHLLLQDPVRLGDDALDPSELNLIADDAAAHEIDQVDGVLLHLAPEAASVRAAAREPFISSQTKEALRQRDHALVVRVLLLRSIFWRRRSDDRRQVLVVSETHGGSGHSYSPRGTSSSLTAWPCPPSRRSKRRGPRGRAGRS